MKYHDGEYVMDKKDKADIEWRIQVFKTENRINDPVHPVLVTTYGLKADMYSGIFQNTVTLEDLFPL